jgi:hypothetical protein
MLPDSRLEQHGLLGLRKLERRNPHAGWYLCLLHETPPFFSVGSHALAVHEMDGGMSGLVAKDLSQEVGGAVDEPGGQCDLDTPSVVAPERPLESRARAKPDLVAQLRNAPDPRPLGNRAPQFLYLLGTFSLHERTHSRQLDPGSTAAPSNVRQWDNVLSEHVIGIPKGQDNERPIDQRSHSPEMIALSSRGSDSAPADA